MSRRKLLVAATTLAAATAGWFVTTGPAHAGEQPAAAPARHVRHGFVAGRGNHLAAHSDSFWAGYTVDGRTYTSVSGSWTVPAITCSSSQDSYTSPWVGLDGWDSDSVEQIGIDQDCTNGQLTFAPWVEMYPADSIYFNETVRAGDTITASVTYQGGNSYQLVEADTTRGWSKTYHLSAKAQRNSAEAILEDLGSGIQPVAKFTPLTFSNLQANGTPLASGGRVHRTDLVRGNTNLTTETSLNGGSFTLTWLQSLTKTQPTG